MPPGGVAGASNLPDVALLRIICLVLNDINLLALSLVNREWSEIVRSEECWNGKTVFICNRVLDRQTLRAWYPRWRLGVVEMTYEQRGMLMGLQHQTHLVCHPWRAPPGRPLGRSWVRARVHGSEYLVSITRFSGPDDVILFQDTSTCRLGGAIQVGWTSASNHDEYTQLCDRMHLGRARPDDIWLASTLCSRNTLEVDMPSALRSLLLAASACFDESSPVVARLFLDRAGHAIRVRTECGESQMDFQYPVPEDIELRVFVSVPCTGSNRRCRVKNLPDVQCATMFRQE